MVKCNNEFCYYNTNGLCTNEITVCKILQEKDVVYTEVSECEDKVNDLDKEDPFWYERMLFESYMDQEANGEFD